MIQPTKYDITIYKNATFDQTFTWQDDAGNIFDLSSYTAAEFQVRSSIEAPDPPAISLALGTGITLASTAPNISLFMDATDTEAINIASGFYNLTLVDSYGITTRLLEGKVRISPSVVR